MTFDPPGIGNGIHWRAIALLVIPPILGLIAVTAIGQLHIFLSPIVWFVGLPFGGVFAWKYSCYVADTHAQPWGYIAFIAAMASSMFGLAIPFMNVSQWLQYVGSNLVRLVGP